MRRGVPQSSFSGHESLPSDPSLSRQEKHSLVVHDLNIVALYLGGEAGFIAGHGIFHELAGFEVSLGSRRWPPRSIQLLNDRGRRRSDCRRISRPSFVKQAQEFGKAQGERVGRVAKQFDAIVDLEFRVALRREGVDDQQAPSGLDTRTISCSTSLGLGKMVERALARHQIKRAAGEGKMLGIAATKAAFEICFSA